MTLKIPACYAKLVAFLRSDQTVRGAAGKKILVTGKLSIPRNRFAALQVRP